MISKKTSLCLAIAAAASLSASTVMATAYDSVTLTGGDPNETHDFSYILNECVNDCIPNNGAGLEVDFVMNIENASPLGGVTGALILPTASDRYACKAITVPLLENATLDASGNCAGGPSFSLFSGFFADLGGALSESAFASQISRFDIQTNQQGRITGGWWLGDFTFVGLDFFLFWNFEDRVFCGVGGGPGGAAGVDTIDIAGMLADPTNCLAGTNVANGFTASSAAIGNVAYNTCDTRDACGTGGKAVPVPALAAAALGLGLVGVTLLTGRKKKLK